MNALEDPEILSKLQPKEFYKKWLDTNFPTRPDKRHVNEYRPITLETDTISTADSSCTLRLGNTLVISGIKLEVAEPVPNKEKEGMIITNVTFCSGCSPQIRTGPPTELAQQLSQTLDELLKFLIPSESLVAIDGKIVWVVHVDAMVINDSGNIFDAIFISSLAAFIRLRLPKIRLNEETGLIYSDSGYTTPIQLGTMLPVPLTFAFSKEPHTLIMDPTEHEESVLNPQIGSIIYDPISEQIIYAHSILIPPALIEKMLSSKEVQDHIVFIHKKLQSLK